MIEVGGLKVPTLDDIRPEGSRVLVRIDINSPVDSSGKLLDASRIRAHYETIKELVDRGNSLVLASHQGRPGDDDFVSLRAHAEAMKEVLGINVKFVEDVIGPYAREAIRGLKGGEVALLENLRLVSEEIIEAPPEQQAKTFLVRALAPLFNYFVNDAFATAHRSQPSIVGFPMVLPSAAGRLMERELLAISRILNEAESPKVFALGGSKVSDTLKIIENLTKKRMADRILTGGLVAELFAVAKGLNIGKQNMQILESKGILGLVPKARRILLAGAPVEIPVDFLTEGPGGEVKSEPATRVSGVIKDIGEATIGIYSSFLREAKVATLRGPMGVIEDERFREGTKALIRAAVEGSGYTIIGGGHLISAVDSGVSGERVHVSTGGGALLIFLSGDSLPAVEALSMGAGRHG